MTLREFIQNLQDFVKENPDTLDMTVITSIDSEGNGYSEIYYDPTMGWYEDGNFSSCEEDIEEYGANAVCVN